MAVVVLGALFVSAVAVVPNLSYVNLLYLEQQQMRNIALSSLKTILFDEGYPTNWGSMHGMSMFNGNDVKRFGLALLSDPSFYVLDYDKVQRLSSSNPMGSISYARMKELLGLSGYDFSIFMRPLFHVDNNVKITRPNDQTATIDFNVNVSRYDGQPVPNAIIYATIIYSVEKSRQDFETRTTEVRRNTDSLGRCQGTETLSTTVGDLEDAIVIFRVTVADRATVMVSSQDAPHQNDIAKISVVGDTVNATITEDPSRDARWITNIQMYNFKTSVNLYNGSGTGDPDLQWGKRDSWNQTFPGLSSSEPGILILTVSTDPSGPGGRTMVLLVGPYSLWSESGIIEFNPVTPSSGAAVSVQRDVIIAGMAYIAELRLWKV